MISYDEAMRILRAHIPKRDGQLLALTPGLVLARDVISRQSLPPFDNAAMDGFALQVGRMGVKTGTEFEVAGAQAAGDGKTFAADPAAAWEIMTGARLPEGLDAVVPVEEVDVLDITDGRPRRIRLRADVRYGQHVRRSGEDVARGQCVVTAGTRLQAAHLALLSALGVGRVESVPAPKVALLTTGRELVDDPEQPLESGQIRNSNAPYLATRLAEAGAELVWRQTVADEVDAFLDALARSIAAGAQMVLSTGAVSMGRYDFVPEALRRIGAQLHFHKVKIRPGKPVLFATLPGGQPFFGLPGNPVSSAVGLRFFVEPALRRWMGMDEERPLRVPLATSHHKRNTMRAHLKGLVGLGQDGRLWAQILPGQESFRIAPLARANAWIVLDEPDADLPAGTSVEVYPVGHLSGFQLNEGLG